LALLTLLPLCATARDNGAEFYDVYCSSCHGLRGQGSSVAPSLIGTPSVMVHFMLDTGRMPAPLGDDNDIPRVPRFTYAQIAQIVRYVGTFSRTPVASALPLVEPGNVNRGRTLFAENCAQCHGAGADGDSVGADNVAPSLMAATSFQVVEAARAGPGIMPRFGNDLLSDRDLDDIVRYVNDLQTHAEAPDGPDAGGISLAHIGPVAEGFIAWAFGIGALLLFIRRIGTAGDDA
jgi:ubiquinol-cytochrome c reductase cytochrome c subunit